MTAVPRIEFVPLAEGDLPCLHEWLNRAHVAQWWDGPMGYNEVLQKYGGFIRSESIRPYVVLLDGAPGGYIQSWVAALEGESWWEGVSDPGVLGIGRTPEGPVVLMSLERGLLPDEPKWRGIALG